ncbi:unnamed protein product, partial [Discosporangium mesarthrocarpum]
GTPGNTTYLLISGQVSVIACGGSGAVANDDEVETDIIHPVDYFGERSLVDADPRMASVVCKSATARCLELERREFNSLFGPIRCSLQASAGMR